MISQSRSWILTLPAEEYSKEYVEEKLKKYTYVGQLEKGGKTAYLHWQIYIENRTPIAFDTLRKKFSKGHFEQRHGSKKDVYAYCTKADTSLGITVKNGTIDTNDDSGERTDLDLIRDAILVQGLTPTDVYLTIPQSARCVRYVEVLYSALQEKKFKGVDRTVKNYYLHGSPGIGKTRFLHDKYGSDDIYTVDDYTHPWDEYKGQKVLVLDEYYSGMKWNTILKVLDRYSLELPCRYSNKYAGWDTVWLVANSPFEYQYSEIAEKYPERYPAFVRRFDGIYRMDTPGVLADETALYTPVRA